MRAPCGAIRLKQIEKNSVQCSANQPCKFSPIYFSKFENYSFFELSSYSKLHPLSERELNGEYTAERVRLNYLFVMMDDERVQQQFNTVNRGIDYFGHIQTMKTWTFAACLTSTGDICRVLLVPV